MRSQSSCKAFQKSASFLDLSKLWKVSEKMKEKAFKNRKELQLSVPENKQCGEFLQCLENMAS